MLRKVSRKASLLKLIYDIGGEGTREQINAKISEYWELSDEELEIEEGVGKPIYWHHVSSVCQALKDKDHYLENPRRGVWKITKAGRRELSRLGLIDKPFPIAASLQGQDVLTSTKGAKEPNLDDEEIIGLILEEIAPDGPKQFPDDFLDNKNCTDFYEVELPGTQLHLAPLSQTTITSPKGYFRYQAKNPPEAKYILYSHKVGLKRVKVPRDNLTLFKAVKTYERYCDEVMRKSFELFLELTYDEQKAEILANEIENRLDLRAKRN